ncbi:Pyrimidine-nucleoside phosphorylase [bioreactor metagenome]|uniref:Pyrimidine-nucleoside phosphorylase n=1 Tax=bioreactor metagenome TaxID=1076179 RepID=A0A644T1D3_9ZZZZ|nr:pyrimidine-nucleoside phosphorylase [Negativicutes bacterium]
MRLLDIITKKRDGKTLDASEINALVQAYTMNNLPDYQMAAWLMAVYLNGMIYQETAALTLAMAESGDKMDLSSVPGIKVDKHSTGGVADTTTLVLGPLVAAAGIPVAKMSGRGLGFTGGTIDKLEAIPGFKIALTQANFIENIKKHGMALTSQNSMIAPADGKMYALRDVTATVESIPLIASSIMSKKIAAGADKILLDVKVGSGAFMKDIKSAVELASTMVEIGRLVERDTIAILTNMDEPLGDAIGNSLEVQEAIDVLKGGGPGNLRHVCLVLGSYMLKLAGHTESLDEGYQILRDLLENGSALEKFKEFIIAQGGNPAIVENNNLLPQAKYKITVKSNIDGYIEKIDAAKIGYVAMILGAGREFKEQEIDLAAGMVLKCRVGDKIECGQQLAIIHANDQDKISVAIKIIQEALTFCSQQIQPTKLILGIVDKNGYKSF